MNYSTTQINRDFLIKVHGVQNGTKYNTLVGVSGMLQFIGIDRANKFLARAYAAMADVCTCKVYGGLAISFYAH